MGAWFATGGEVYDIVFRTKDRLGPGYRIIHAKGRHIQTETGAHLAYVSYMDEGICADEEGENETALIRSLKHELHEGSLLKANRYDYLTGLPSMSWFFEQAEAWKESSQTGTNAGVILFIDLCGMKYFNHKYGFAQGDKYLQSFAMILSEIFGHEHCSRLAQDHFGVYTEEDGVEEKLRQLFQN